MPLGLEEQRPAGAKPAQHVVEARRGGDQFGLGGAVEIGAAKARRALEAAILVEDDARRDQAGPRQIVGQQCRPLPVFGEVQHER